mgnify:CR=1 FL=1
MDGTYTVYMHKFPNGKVYIGITCQSVEERWRGGEGYKAQAVYRAIQKYGWSNIEHIVVKTGLTKAQAEQEEMRLIKEFSSNNPEHGYNIDNGGNCYGTHSEETRAKIAQKNREWVRSKETCERISKALKGKKMPEFRKEKIRRTLKGRKFTEEHRRKISQGEKGKIISQEVREKISRARKGQAFKCSNPEERGEKISQAMQTRNAERPEIMEKMRERSVAKCSKPIAQTDKNGSLIKVWESGAAVARAFGVSKTHVSRVCRNEGTLFQGYFWSFL